MVIKWKDITCIQIAVFDEYEFCTSRDMIENKGKFELCIILWGIFTTKYLLDRGLQK